MRYMDAEAGDGLLDLVIGSKAGVTLAYYENTGTSTAPAFTPWFGTDNPFNGLVVGKISVPVFYDVNGT